MPLLSLFGSTAMAPFIICDIESHPPELVWAEYWSPSTCGHSCLQLLWLFDIRLPHIIILCVLCLDSPWLVIGPDCGLWLSHYTECEKSACSCCQFVDIVSSYSSDTAVFADRLYKIWQMGLDSEDWISSCDLRRFSSVKYSLPSCPLEEVLSPSWPHTSDTQTFAAWAVSTHLSTSCCIS